MAKKEQNPDDKLAEPMRHADETDCRENPVTLDEWPLNCAPLPVDVKSANVTLEPAAPVNSGTQMLWALIHQTTPTLAFSTYSNYLETVLCPPADPRVPAPKNLLTGVDAYQVLRAATEAFLLDRTPTMFDLTHYTVDETRMKGGRDLAKELADYLDGSTLPYINRIVAGLEGIGRNPFCRTDTLQARFLEPFFLELFWSYWEEEGALVQAINAISLRFQNKRVPGGDRDPLANLEIHPLRPLANLLWGYIQDEDHRLTVARRAYEYRHQYGLPLIGRAVPKLRVADDRSKFLAAFHSLLRHAALFYERSSNLTVRADAFPLLNALREVHMLLAEGAHNQFRDLTWTARVEMMIQQWLLARPEIREFLGARPSMPYAEPWMAPVDSLKRLLGWNDTPVTFFHDLAQNGELILLSIRYGDWTTTAFNENDARGWAQFWKTEVQRYIHAYHAVTGVDLAVTAVAASDREVDATPPSVLLQQRFARQRR